jgi:hypothetical protein
MVLDEKGELFDIYQCLKKKCTLNEAVDIILVGLKKGATIDDMAAMNLE